MSIKGRHKTKHNNKAVIPSSHFDWCTPSWLLSPSTHPHFNINSTPTGTKSRRRGRLTSITCVRACMHACLRACVHACVAAYACIHMRARVCTCVCTCMRAWMRMCACVCVRACVRAGVRVFMSMRACMCARVRAPPCHVLVHR